MCDREALRMQYRSNRPKGMLTQNKNFDPEGFDFASILKALQTLTEIVQLNDLLRKLTQVIWQNSGGDRCALILPDQNGQK